MIDFSTLQGLTIPEGAVAQIADASGKIIWTDGKPVVLQVEKITSNTYASEITYTDEQFILLDIYPKTNGTVKITYGGLTKTITDTSGAAEPNAQQVFFGTFNGSKYDGTPASGELKIKGDCYAFGQGLFKRDKILSFSCTCITKIRNWGLVEIIPPVAFAIALSVSNGLTGNIIIPSTVKRIESNAFDTSKISSVVIPSSVEYIGSYAFFRCSITGELIIPSSVEEIGKEAFSACNNLTTVTIGEGISVIGSGAFLRRESTGATSGLQKVIVLAKNPPTLTIFEGKESSYYDTFGVVGNDDYFLPNQIIVPKGCGATYKAAEGWSTYADYIVEAS